MNIVRTLKQPFIWLIRFRHRCGYGVHSPFAFDLITNVFYEKTPYYAYVELREKEKTEKQDTATSIKVKQLLFRLTNRIQPQLIVDAGENTSAGCYLRAAKREVHYIFVTTSDGRTLKPGESPDLIYIHQPESPDFAEKTFYKYLPFVHEGSVCVIEGIHQSKAMKNLWKKLCMESSVGITFDLYDVGILFFDTKKIKQHYIVNF